MRLAAFNYFKRLWAGLSIQGKLLSIVSFAFAMTALMALVHDYQHEQKYLEQLFINRGQVIFEQIQIVRHWNAEQGGIYTFIKPGEQANPYLYQVGPAPGVTAKIEPEITDNKGRRLRLINPAIMTRELSELTQQQNHLRYKLTSLNLINPLNKPDEFERQGLQTFEQGSRVHYSYEQINGKIWFRYMAPLSITHSCLKCHGFQGYKVGEIRGGISVSFPVEELLNEARYARRITSINLMLGYLFIVLGIIVAIRRYFIKPIEQLSQFSKKIGSGQLRQQPILSSDDELGKLTQTLIEIDQTIHLQQKERQQLLNQAELNARRDPLTQCWNRRYLYEIAPEMYHSQRVLCTLMFDIDHFKAINDRFGHAVGDEVLKHFCAQIRQLTRSDDLLFRLGGEEFLLIMPHTHIAEGLHTAERIRGHVADSQVELLGVEPFHFTISIGLYCSSKTTLDHALLETDRLMYQAKNNGRNQVVSAEKLD